MATKIKTTDSYELWLLDDGTYSASLVGGISTGTAGCASELDCVEQLLICQRDLVNQRNDEQKSLRAALPQNWLHSMWRADDEDAPLTA